MAMRPATLRLFGVLLIGGALTTPAWGQQLLLDQPVRAGELTLFRDLADPNAYYFISDHPRLAVDSSGLPQFSFMRYVENVPSGEEGEGGGIVHAVVALAVTPEQLRDAQRALQHINPAARIQGPAVYRSGKFGLVSSFKDPAGKLVTQVVGLGNAPILDGAKAAVSIQLTKLGAKILWESFETATPDISFTFEMELGGFRAPHRAVLDANFDQIYNHDLFRAGLRTSYIAAEIKAAFDDLRKTGAIKLTEVGTDEKQEALIMTAYNKIVDMMFEPVNGTGTPSLDSLSGTQGGTSLLDRASQMFKENRDREDQQNKEIRARADEIRKRNEAASEKQRTAAAAQAEAASLKQRLTESQNRGGTLSRDADERDARATQLRQQAEEAQRTADTLKAAAGSDAAKQAAAQRAQGDANLLKGRADAAQKQAEIFRKYAGETQTESDKLRQQADQAQVQADKLQAAAPKELEPLPSELSSVNFAVVASYELKREHRSGAFHIDLNKSMPDSLTLRFDQNIGDLRAIRQDPTIFRQVNLDDPLYRQRNVVALLDGINAQDFGQYVNAVTLQMTKHHSGGDLTTKELRITRTDFNRQGNAYELMYGWKNDTDRQRWMEYSYKTVWSFFGGRTVAIPEETTTIGTVVLTPPYQRRYVELQADPTKIAASQVRAITVRLFYQLAGQQLVKQVTLNTAGGKFADRIDFMLPADSYDYEYEITWTRAGNQTTSSGRQPGNASTLFVDPS